MSENNDDITELPLTGLRVVEIGQAVCAPLCARHLADLGAEVIKIENPQGGDLARRYDSVVNGTSAYFTWANYGKKSVTLDLRADEGKAALLALLEEADVLIHNLGPGAMDRLGFDRDTLSTSNPKLINCAISGYGAAGPMHEKKAFDLIIQGEVGLLSVTGTAAEPAKVGISVVDMCTALYGLSAIQASLFQRAHTGRGSYIELSLFDCIAEWMMAPAYHQLYSHTAPKREGARHNMMVPYGVYATGEVTAVNFAVQTAGHWQTLCSEVLRLPDLAGDSRFATNNDRVTNRAELEPLIIARLKQIGHAEIVKRLSDSRIPVGEVNDLAAFVEHPQLRVRERWFDIEVGGSSATALRSPFDVQGRAPVGKKVPALGEHTREVLEQLAARVR